MTTAALTGQSAPTFTEVEGATMTKRQQAALDRVTATANAYAAAVAALQKADRARWRTARSAVRAGVTQRRVAEALGVSEGLLSRRLSEQDTPSERRKTAPADDEPADTPRPGTVPAAAVTTEPARLVVVGPGSVRSSQRYGARRTAFVDVAPRLTLRDVLESPAVEGAAIERVFLCGPAPTTGEGVSEVEGTRAWFLARVPGWRAERTYLPDSREASGVYVHEPSGARVEVLRGVTWTGESARAADMREAWGLLATALDTAWRKHGGATVLSTPGTTGRELWLRTIPAGVEYPTLSAELRGLIGGAGSSGQGRSEVLPPPRYMAPECPQLTELDGVMMYAGLTWGLGVGEPTWHAGDVEPALLRQRGRWRVTATVPADWEHVGLLPARQEGSDKLWCFPRHPGERFTTWADGAEVWLAMTAGWRVEVHEGFTQREGKPLNVWTDLLLKAHGQLAGEGEPVRLARRMVRAVLLYTIGAFAQRPRMVTRTAPLSAAASLPGNVDRRVVGDELVWEEAAPVSEWTARTLHPEWSAAIWARARKRLLDGPGATPNDGPTGALHVRFRDVVAFRTDALYLAQHPGWPDGDKPGRFRVKWRATGTVPWPQDTAALLALRG